MDDEKKPAQTAFVGKACESAGHIFVDRSGPKKVLETIRQAKASLKDGVSLVVFPEGARTFTGHMGYFKKGAFQLLMTYSWQWCPSLLMARLKSCHAQADGYTATA